MSVQTTIDFTRRGEQLRLLDRVQFERGLGVSPSTLVLILRTVDSFAGESGWCWASQETMAHRANLSPRTVNRAISLLFDLFLLHKQVRSTGNRMQCRFRIAWANLHESIEEFESRSGDQWTDIHPDSTTDKATDKAADSTTDRTADIVSPSLSAATGQPVRNRVAVGVQPAMEAQEPPPPGTTDKREEVEILDLLEGTVCRSEAVRLSRKVDRESVTIALAEYRHPSNRNRIRSPGALVHRLDHGEWPDASIRTLDDIRQAEQARSRQRDAREAENERRRKADREARERRQWLEDRHGKTLDAMTWDDRIDLARECLDEFNFSRMINGGDYRLELLEAMAITTVTKTGALAGVSDACKERYWLAFAGLDCRKSREKRTVFKPCRLFKTGALNQTQPSTLLIRKGLRRSAFFDRVFLTPVLTPRPDLRVGDCAESDASDWYWQGVIDTTESSTNPVSQGQILTDRISAARSRNDPGPRNLTQFPGLAALLDRVTLAAGMARDQ